MNRTARIALAKLATLVAAQESAWRTARDATGPGRWGPLFDLVERVDLAERSLADALASPGDAAAIRGAITAACAQTCGRDREHARPSVGATAAVIDRLADVAEDSIPLGPPPPSA